jgi:hypothetical protein
VTRALKMNIAPLLFLILYYRKSGCNIAFLCVGLEARAKSFVTIDVLFNIA